MIIPVAVDDYHQHWQDFHVVAQNIFPMLSYTPAQTRDLLNQWQAQSEGKSFFLVETRTGQVFACRSGWDVLYLVPSDWGKRYDILREALEEIKADFLRSNADKLSLGINDGFPSHTLYYAGMLPMLGFEVHSGEITLQADEALLNGLALPVLPLGVREVPGERGRLMEYAALYAEAHAAHERRPSSEPDYQKWEASLGDALQNEDVLNTWVGLEAGGKTYCILLWRMPPRTMGRFLVGGRARGAAGVLRRGLGQIRADSLSRRTEASLWCARPPVSGGHMAPYGASPLASLSWPGVSG